MVFTGAQPVAAEPDCKPSVARSGAAVAMARACDTRVEVESKRTSTTQVFVNPDGTSTVEQYAYPRRIRQADGSWSELDTTLAAGADKTLAARASTVDVRFSGGGSGPLVRARRHGGELALSWPAPLPEPVVSGARATYPEVLPGVDLVATALGTGFSFVLVVKNREAALNPALRQVSLTSALSGLRWDGLRAVDKAGREVFAAAAPAMWDSSGEGVSSVAAPGRDARRAPVELVAEAGGKLTLKPDAGLLTDPGVKFPLYVDPTVGFSSWTMINEAARDTSYWSYDRNDCTGGWDTECAKVGFYPDGNDGATYSRYRSMFDFSTAPWQGKQVLGGTRFTIDLLHSARGDSRTDLYTVFTQLGSWTTWSGTAGSWGNLVSSVTNSSTNTARKLSEFPLDAGTVERWQPGGHVVLGLTAQNEENDSGWKKFDASTARLIVNTNTVPDPPSGLTVDGKACATGAQDRPYISTLTPTWRARVRDGDGEGVKASFYWQLINGNGTPAAPHQGPREQYGVPSDTTAVVSPSPALAENATYSFWATASDAQATSGESVRCEFVTDTVRPAAVTVASDIYKEGNEISGGVGQTGTFTFVSSPDVAAFKWGFSDPPAWVAKPSWINPAKVSWTPTEGGAHTLYVIAVDRAGNQSPRKAYQFIVDSPSPALARWNLDEPAGTTQAADDTGNGRPLTLNGGATFGEPGRLLPGPDGRSRSALRLDSADDYASRPDFMDTRKSFSVSAWVKLTRKGADGTVVSQRGNNTCAFFLYYSAGEDRWAMILPSQDAAGATAAVARSTTLPQAGVWTHLTGAYDAAAKTAHLYVNGVLEGSAASATSWDASGDVQVGGGWGGGPFDGAIAEVQTWNRMITATEAAKLADPRLNAKVAEWHFDEVGAGPAYDSSGMFRDLRFYGGAQIPPSGAGYVLTGLRLDGEDDYIAPVDAVVNTDQSFTVSAWVRLSDLTRAQMLVVGGFLLYYDPISGGKWVFAMPAPDSDWSNTTFAIGSAVTPSAYHNLVGVFDAQRRHLQLYVDGALKATVPMKAAWRPWRSQAPLLIGRGHAGNFAKGDIDEVQVFQGVVPDPGTPAPGVQGRVDFNGDGKADRCRRVGDDRLACTLSAGTGFGTTITSGVLDWGQESGRAWVDVNADGKTDFCRVRGTQNHTDAYLSCTLSTGTGFGPDVNSRNTDWGYPEDRAWVDADGDGRTDYCRRVGSVTSMRVACTPFAGGGFAETFLSRPLDWGQEAGRAWVDVNADGKTDYCRVRGTQNHTDAHLSCTPSTGTGFGADINSGNTDWGDAGNRAWADVNADGKTDYCRGVGSDTGQSMACTLSAGTGFGTTITSGVLDWGQEAGRAWVDVNADGKADFCRVRGTQNHTDAHLSCTPSTSTGFGADIDSPNLDGGYLPGRTWVDPNGDGKADYCRRVGTVSDQKVGCTLSAKDGFGMSFYSESLDWGQEE
ncbi:LamG domain-containing protein [Nonomuraea dietziae]|uniref:LamG domain-containing protein n=1 Tax=Nonomuraea dietziae TaxID=65515 RepID=UPI0034150A31